VCAVTRMVFCTFPGTAPYKVEEDTEYMGHELAVLTQADTAARSPAQCASACTGHHGRMRCSAWTFSHMPSSSASRCTLRSSRGSEAANSSSAVSGYISGVLWVLITVRLTIRALATLGQSYATHMLFTDAALPYSMLSISKSGACISSSNHLHPSPCTASCYLPIAVDTRRHPSLHPTAGSGRHLQ
jgi:hypothetical protein